MATTQDLMAAAAAFNNPVNWPMGGKEGARKVVLMISRGREISDINAAALDLHEAMVPAVAARQAQTDLTDDEAAALADAVAAMPVLAEGGTA